MLNIVESESVSLDIYKNKHLINYMNANNVITVNHIDEIEEGIAIGYFRVPYEFVEQAWGIEKVFLPFSNKLFKIVHTTKANTSVQFHPLKSEKYISLCNNTIIYDDHSKLSLKKYRCADIKRNTIHSMNKDSKVFEEQDNVLFDKNETVRISDSLGRDTNIPQEYYKYLLPQYKGAIKISDIPNDEYDEKNDKFVFIIDGSIEIKINNKTIILKGKEDLYFFDKKILIEKVTGKYKVMNCVYYRVIDYDE